MKTPKNLFAVVIASCLFIVTAKAQTTQTAAANPWHFGVGLESGISHSPA